MSGIADSLFVSAEIHEREVTLADGTKHTLHFRELPTVEFRKFHIAEQSDKEDKRAGSMAKLISAALCDPDGKPAITYERALQLKQGAANALMAAILDVNGIGAKPGND